MIPRRLGPLERGGAAAERQIEAERRERERAEGVRRRRAELAREEEQLAAFFDRHGFYSDIEETGRVLVRLAAVQKLIALLPPDDSPPDPTPEERERRERRIALETTARDCRTRAERIRQHELPGIAAKLTAGPLNIRVGNVNASLLRGPDDEQRQEAAYQKAVADWRKALEDQRDAALASIAEEEGKAEEAAAALARMEAEARDA